MSKCPECKFDGDKQFPKGFAFQPGTNFSKCPKCGHHEFGNTTKKETSEIKEHGRTGRKNSDRQTETTV